MIIKNLSMEYIVEAQKLALDNYNEEKESVSSLPQVDSVPDLGDMIENGLGVAAFENERMVGFICCVNPWDGAFKTAAKGTFVPMHAHGAIKENRGMIYQRLYQAAAEKWVKNGVTSHAIALYAHDKEAINAFFTYGFGRRCVDAIRPMEMLEAERNKDNSVCRLKNGMETSTSDYKKGSDDLSFYELDRADVAQVRDMRHMLSEHMGESPCFMYSSSEEYQDWLSHAETRNSRIFVAKYKEQLVSYLEIADFEAETFITERDDMMNIYGAYLLSEFRGKGIYSGLLNYAISALKKEGYKRLGVDYESINPTANGFWTKYFDSYTTSVVRRIDEGVLRREERK